MDRQTDRPVQSEERGIFASPYLYSSCFFRLSASSSSRGDSAPCSQAYVRPVQGLIVNSAEDVSPPLSRATSSEAARGAGAVGGKRGAARQPQRSATYACRGNDATSAFPCSRDMDPLGSPPRFGRIRDPRLDATADVRRRCPRESSRACKLGYPPCRQSTIIRLWAVLQAHALPPSASGGHDGDQWSTARNAQARAQS